MDVLKLMLNHVKEPETLKRLLTYCRALLGAGCGSEAQDFFSNHKAGVVLSSGFEEGLRFAGCVVYLLDAQSGYGSLNDVRHFVDYSGPSTFAKAVRNLLKVAQEPRGNSSYTQILPQPIGT